MCRESAVLLGFSAPQPPGQLTAGKASGWVADEHIGAFVLCYFRLNNLLRPAMNNGIGDTEDTPDPSFKFGEKKDAFVGTLEIGLHSSPHPGRSRPTNVSFKGCSPESGHSNSE
ncbi:hypothetical protein CHARACLAT_024304 [Characodon lateralis]|uniref:Uncharacterized protein n=1 Tax=Characodon lateralis TaxID=208331 RepID=A0ABU7DJC0_9TELE|nr:hypothetical protein [Characodon lateralis]